MTELTINTRDFGVIPVSQSRIYTFPQGLFAFENLESFALISPLGENMYPCWLQSTEQVKPCFIAFEPTQLLVAYEPFLDEYCLKIIDFAEGDELLFLVLAVIPEDYNKTTINLKSPLVLNKTKHRGVQIILEADYPLRHSIFEQEGDE